MGPNRILLRVRVPHRYVAERRYVLDVVLSEWLGFDYDLEFVDGSRVVIRLAADPNDRELTLPDVLFATPPEAWLTERSMPVVPLARLPVDTGPSAHRADGDGPAANGSVPRWIPVLFGDSGSAGRLWQETADGLSLAVDIFGSVFYLLTRYEEVARPVRDKHDRFPSSASLAAAEGFLERPIVDEFVDLLWVAMQSLWPAITRPSSSFTLRLTHDVDEPLATFKRRFVAVARGIGGDFLHRRDPGLAAHRVRGYLGARAGRVDLDPFNTFDALMDTSEKHGLRSTFYFMSAGASGPYERGYQLSAPPIAQILRSINERGHEVGLHASYGSYISDEAMRREFSALKAACQAVGFGQPTWGVRQHFLRFENPQTWRSQEGAGFDHDSTLGFADQIGFRAGTCREYPLFDVLGRRRLALRERPLIVMDATLFGYLGLGPDEAMSRTRAIVDACRRHRGEAVLCFHNDRVAARRPWAAYRDLVDTLVEAI